MTALITPMPGLVSASAKLNIRGGAPSIGAPVVSKIEPGTELQVIGLADGDVVQSNGHWYAGRDDTFFWSGACGAFRASNADPAKPLAVNRRPNGSIRPLGDDDIRKVFGTFAFSEKDAGRIELDPAWEQAYIVDLPTPSLAKCHAPSIQVHRKATDAFQRVFDSITAADLAARIITFGGTFVPRHKGWDPQRGLSSHSWGIAVDLNVAWNGYGSTPAAIGATGSLRELVPLFEREGFAWGGYFEPKSICDGMHFELARLDL